MSSPLWSQIVGHEVALKNLRQMVMSNRLPSSLMFLGPSGIGKKKVALALAQLLVCVEKNSPCGICGACIRVAKEQSENLYVLTSQKGSPHKIEQVRELLRWISYAPLATSRLVIVDDAQLLNPQAANALLKSVEEPPERTHFIFIAPSRERLISTLRSRSQSLRFQGLSTAQLRQIAPAPDWVIESAMGRVDRLQNLQSEDWTQIRQKAHQSFCLALSGDLENAVLQSRETVSTREEAQVLAEFWLQFVRDIWLQKINWNPLFHPDLKDTFTVFTQKSIEVISDISMDLLKFNKDLQQNADIQLSLESMLRSWGRA